MQRMEQEGHLHGEELQEEQGGLLPAVAVRMHIIVVHHIISNSSCRRITTIIHLLVLQVDKVKCLVRRIAAIITTMLLNSIQHTQHLKQRSMEPEKPLLLD